MHSQLNHIKFLTSFTLLELIHHLFQMVTNPWRAWSSWKQRPLSNSPASNEIASQGGEPVVQRCESRDHAFRWPWDLETESTLDQSTLDGQSDGEARRGTPLSTWLLSSSNPLTQMMMIYVTCATNTSCKFISPTNHSNIGRNDCRRQKKSNEIRKLRAGWVESESDGIWYDLGFTNEGDKSENQSMVIESEEVEDV